MCAARTTIGNYCCRLSITQILNKCKWLEVKYMIGHSAITILHTIITHKQPKAIISLHNKIINTRPGKEISTRYIPCTAKYRKFFIHEGIKIYNNVPSNIKLKSTDIFF